jgi:hypothetical protein
MTVCLCDRSSATVCFNVLTSPNFARSKASGRALNAPSIFATPSIPSEPALVSVPPPSPPCARGKRRAFFAWRTRGSCRRRIVRLVLVATDTIAICQRCSNTLTVSESMRKRCCAAQLKFDLQVGGPMRRL